MTPSLIHAGVWLFVILLYTLGWSHLLIPRDPATLIAVLLLVVLPFTAGNLLGCAIRFRVRLGLPFRRYPHATLFMALAWAGFSVMEVIIFDGVPLLWLLQGDLTRNYATFGVPTAHGLANGVMFAVSAASLDLFFTTRKLRWLALHMMPYVWAILLLSRQNLMVFALAAGVILLTRAGRSAAVPVAIGLAVAVAAFGFLGDLRSGRDLFMSVSEVRSGVPDRLPTALLWFYMYLVTPLNNLLYNVLDQLRSPFMTNGIGFFAPLLPSVLRDRLFEAVEWNPSELPFEFTGYMVTQSYNVSTGFIGAALDLGLLGVAVAAGLYGWMSGFLWRRHWVLTKCCVTVLIVLNSFAPSFTSLPLLAFLLFALALDRTRLRESHL